MFEHATLQEAYTGALIAGKGKALNNINIIMERARLPSADWARVRFGAGTPWRRCWCVITPPDEKDVQKMQKQLGKKKSAYDRSVLPTLKGDIKFYDTKKTKKIRPIATISDAYSAFAIYPQSKPLIDASTLVKVEGAITIHSNPPTTSEGFVFVMPEVHPAVSGFEIMLRWLFPVFDTFALYGRPGRLVADTTDARSLMFAMPKHRRYGYLEILDVSGLILEPGSGNWKEGQWRKKMKELTGKRMTAIEASSQTGSRYSSRRNTRNSFGPSRSRIHFDDNASIRSSPAHALGPGHQVDGAFGIPRTDSAPPGAGAFEAPPRSHGHQRSMSETHRPDRFASQPHSNFDGGYEAPPMPPPHAVGFASGREPPTSRYLAEVGSTPDRISSEDEHNARSTPVRELQELQATSAPEPVASPPAFSHGPGAMPISKPYQAPELRRENSRMSNATLSQLAGASGVVGYHPQEEPRSSEDHRRQIMSQQTGDYGDRGVDQPDANLREFPANQHRFNEGLVAVSKPRFSFDNPSPALSTSDRDGRQKYSQLPPQFPFPSNTSTSYVDSRSAPESSHAHPTQHPSYQPPQAFAVASSQRQGSPSGDGHNYHQSNDSTNSTASQPTRIQTSPSVVRKPLPTRTASIPTPASAETESSSGSLGDHFLDQAAFDMIGREDRKLTPLPETQIHRQNSGVSSIYDDNASTVSPDYASTRRSVETQKSVERPRAGVMKTVGDASTPQYQPGHVPNPSIDIDFGPTLNLTSDRVPLRSQSPGPSQAFGRAASPAPGAYLADGGRGSPVRRPDSSGNSRSPARKPVAENAHYRDNSGESRTMAWQPGTAIGSPGNRMSITPEQFVAQRAAVQPPTPLYAHQRQVSNNTLRGNTPTPPPGNRPGDYRHSRNNSSDLLQRPHSRGPSELLQRPSSRGASVALGPSGNGDMPTSLSAKEQEHVARMTGSPLVNMTHNTNKHGPQGGLVGAIEVREKEKQQMKQGLNSAAVQHAITQRQQQALYQQQQIYHNGMASEYRVPQSQYGGNMSQHPQQFPQSQQQYAPAQQQYPQPQRQQQGWGVGVNPAASVFAQGGGWSASTPSPAYATPLEQGRQSPSQYAGRQQPQQQQYFPPQPPNAQGRGNAGYQHGHGY